MGRVVVAIVLLVSLFGSLSVGYAATTSRYENINIVVQPTATPSRGSHTDDKFGAFSTGEKTCRRITRHPK
jgi:hypothetical protein